MCAEDWKSAVNMYRAREMWDDAYRVAKAHGGSNAAQQVGQGAEPLAQHAVACRQKLARQTSTDPALYPLSARSLTFGRSRSEAIVQ